MIYCVFAVTHATCKMFLLRHVTILKEKAVVIYFVLLCIIFFYHKNARNAFQGNPSCSGFPGKYGFDQQGCYGMFVACGIWCLADVSSVSPSSEQSHTISTLLIKPKFSVLAHAEKQFFSKLVFECFSGKSMFPDPLDRVCICKSTCIFP